MNWIICGVTSLVACIGLDWLGSLFEVLQWAPLCHFIDVFPARTMRSDPKQKAFARFDSPRHARFVQLFVGKGDKISSSMPLKSVRFFHNWNSDWPSLRLQAQVLSLLGRSCFQPISIHDDRGSCYTERLVRISHCECGSPFLFLPPIWVLGTMILYQTIGWLGSIEGTKPRDT